MGGSDNLPLTSNPPPTMVEVSERSVRGWSNLQLPANALYIGVSEENSWRLGVWKVTMFFSNYDVFFIGIFVYLRKKKYLCPNNEDDERRL